MQINYEVSLVMLFRVKKILEQLSRTRFLRDLKFLTFSSLLRSREKRAGTAGFSNPVKHCVLENCSYVFSPHGVPKGVNLQKKLPGSDTYFFENYIPLGIQKRLNENI